MRYDIRLFDLKKCIVWNLKGPIAMGCKDIGIRKWQNSVPLLCRN